MSDKTRAIALTAAVKALAPLAHSQMSMVESDEYRADILKLADRFDGYIQGSDQPAMPEPERTIVGFRQERPPMASWADDYGGKHVEYGGPVFFIDYADGSSINVDKETYEQALLSHPLRTVEP